MGSFPPFWRAGGPGVILLGFVSFVFKFAGGFGLGFVFFVLKSAGVFSDSVSGIVKTP